MQVRKRRCRYACARALRLFAVERPIVADDEGERKLLVGQAAAYKRVYVAPPGVPSHVGRRVIVERARPWSRRLPMVESFIKVCQVSGALSPTTELPFRSMKQLTIDSRYEVKADKRCAGLLRTIGPTESA